MIIGIANSIGHNRGGQGYSALVSAYRERVEADGGIVESEDCLLERITTLKNLGLWDQASAVWLPHGYKATKLYAVKGGAAADLSFSRAGDRYRKSPTYLQRLAANVPALDYTSDSSCPALSLEPARTNLVTQSEDANHANWGPLNLVVTTNAAVAPDGLSTADKITNNGTVGQHRIVQSVSVTSGVQYAWSVYAKAGDAGAYLSLAGFGLGAANEMPVFDLQNGTIDIPATTTVFKSARMEQVLDENGVHTGWYRCIVIAQTTSTSGAPQISVVESPTDNTVPGLSYAGTGVGFYIWGMQCEQGSYATSYIPTTTATVSRIADAVTALTGVSSLIGQTEGTLYFELSAFETNSAISLSDGTLSNRLTIGAGFFTAANQMGAAILNGGVTQGAIAVAYTPGTMLKGCATYRANYLALFINGVKIGEDLSVTIPALSQVRFTSGDAATNPFKGEVRNLSLSTTALTDAQAIALTAA